MSVAVLEFIVDRCGLACFRVKNCSVYAPKTKLLSADANEALFVSVALH